MKVSVEQIDLPKLVAVVDTGINNSFFVLNDGKVYKFYKDHSGNYIFSAVGAENLEELVGGQHSRHRPVYEGGAVVIKF